jgi:hypothetical protein
MISNGLINRNGQGTSRGGVGCGTEAGEARFTLSTVKVLNTAGRSKQ